MRASDALNLNVDLFDLLHDCTASVDDTANPACSQWDPASVNEDDRMAIITMDETDGSVSVAMPGGLCSDASATIPCKSDGSTTAKILYEPSKHITAGANKWYNNVAWLKLANSGTPSYFSAKASVKATVSALS